MIDKDIHTGDTMNSEANKVNNIKQIKNHSDKDNQEQEVNKEEEEEEDIEEVIEDEEDSPEVVDQLSNEIVVEKQRKLTLGGGCKDKFKNCHVVVQSRLCSY